MTSSSNKSGVYLGIFLLVAVIAGVLLFTLPDRRTGGEKLGDAVEALPQGVDKAADQLGDKSPGEQAVDKAGDKLNEARSDLKEASSSASSKAE